MNQPNHLQRQEYTPPAPNYPAPTIYRQTPQVVYGVGADTPPKESFIDSIINWVKANPLIAAGIVAVLVLGIWYFVSMKKKKPKRKQLSGTKVGRAKAKPRKRRRKKKVNGVSVGAPKNYTCIQDTVCRKRGTIAPYRSKNQERKNKAKTKPKTKSNAKK